MSVAVSRPAIALLVVGITVSIGYFTVYRYAGGKAPQTESIVTADSPPSPSAPTFPEPPPSPAEQLKTTVRVLSEEADAVAASPAARAAMARADALVDEGDALMAELGRPPAPAVKAPPQENPRLRRIAELRAELDALNQRQRQ